jgi:carbonic anhydrase/acetyltransferase-like protein (isoleucine patch superfamily)
VGAAREEVRRRRAWHNYYLGLLPPPETAFATWGNGTIVMPPVRVEAAECVELGRNVMLHEYCWLCVKRQPGMPPPRLVIGNNVSINRFVKIVCAGEVVIEDDVLIGDHVYIADTHYTFDDPNRPIADQPLAPPEPVRIGAGSHIGVRAMIQPGVTIGRNGYVGAAAVVGRELPPFSVAVGDPARVIRQYDKAAEQWVSKELSPGEGPTV